MNIPKWFKYVFIAIVMIAAGLCILTIDGCQSRNDDSLDKISEEVLKKDRGIDIEVRPIPKEPR